MRGKSPLCLPLLLLLACQPNQSKTEQNNNSTELSVEQQNVESLEVEKTEQALIKNAQLTANQMENDLLQKQEAEMQLESNNIEPSLIDAAAKKQAELELDLINRAKAESDRKQAMLEQMTSTKKSTEDSILQEKPKI